MSAFIIFFSDKWSENRHTGEDNLVYIVCRLCNFGRWVKKGIKWLVGGMKTHIKSYMECKFEDMKDVIWLEINVDLSFPKQITLNI